MGCLAGGLLCLHYWTDDRLRRPRPTTGTDPVARRRNRIFRCPADRPGRGVGGKGNTSCASTVVGQRLACACGVAIGRPFRCSAAPGVPALECPMVTKPVRPDAHDACRPVDCRPDCRFFSCRAALPGGDSVGGHVGGCHMALHATVAVGFRRSSLGRRYADDAASAVPRADSAFDGHQLDRYSRQPSS